MEKARLYKHPSETCFGVQIATKTIDEGVKAAHIAAEAGAAFVDINCEPGCAGVLVPASLARPTTGLVTPPLPGHTWPDPPPPPPAAAAARTHDLAACPPPAPPRLQAAAPSTKPRAADWGLRCCASPPSWRAWSTASCWGRRCR